MTVEYKGFKIGDTVTFKEDADRHYCHVAGGTGVITDITDVRGAGAMHYVVNAENATWWYTADEIELLPTVEAAQPALLDELTVRTISDSLNDVYAIHGITDGEIVAAVAAYLRGLQDAMGIGRNV